MLSAGLTNWKKFKSSDSDEQFCRTELLHISFALTYQMNNQNVRFINLYERQTNAQREIFRHVLRYPSGAWIMMAERFQIPVHKIEDIAGRVAATGINPMDLLLPEILPRPDATTSKMLQVVEEINNETAKQCIFGWLQQQQPSVPANEQVHSHIPSWVHLGQKIPASACIDLFGNASYDGKCLHGVSTQPDLFHCTCCGTTQIHNHTECPSHYLSRHTGKWIQSWPRCGQTYGLSSTSGAYCKHGVNRCRFHWTCCGSIDYSSHCTGRPNNAYCDEDAPV